MQGKGAPLPLQPIPKSNHNTKTKTKTKNNNKIKVVYTENLTDPDARRLLHSKFARLRDSLGRVENRRSGFSLSVAFGLGFRFAASIRFGLARFPVAE
jgi:hypothetical protein